MNMLGFFFSFLCCRVVESKNAGYAVGDTILAKFSWVSHIIVNQTVMDQIHLQKVNPAVIPPDMFSCALGILGMPG